MYLDKELEFCDGQAETTAAAHDSTNIVDLVKPGDAHMEDFFVIQIDDAVTSGGAATVQFKLVTDDNASFTSAKTLYDSGAIGKATLVAGYQVCKIRLPRGCERYLKVTATIGTAALTAGSWSAFITPDIGTNDFSS